MGIINQNFSGSSPNFGRGILKAIKIKNNMKNFKTYIILIVVALGMQTMTAQEKIDYWEFQKEMAIKKEKEFLKIAKPAIELCHTYKAKILINGKTSLLEVLSNADGIQLASNAIYEFDERPIPKNKLLGVSVHTSEDIVQALRIKADFILLSPVKETKSHPGVPGIGWDYFAHKVKDITVPVFALGGMKPDDTEVAKQKGGHGVAAISGFWPN